MSLIIKKNNVYELTVSGMTSEGSGVCKLDGFAIFVPNTAIGDVCLVRIVKLNKHYGFGKLETLITPAPCRIEVDCDKFLQCGGCTYRHILYDAELLIKFNLVKDSFLRIGGIDTQISEIIPSMNTTRYRNKAQYPVGTDDNNAISGFFAKRSHRIISKSDCELQPHFFADIQQEILSFINSKKIPVYCEDSNTGVLRHIYIRYAEATDEIMVCLVIAKNDFPHIQELISILTKSYKNIKSIVLNINEDATNVILGQKCKTVYGEDYITDIICGIKVKISALSFYQVNRIQAEVLYQKAIDYAKLTSTDTLLDLYCGTGTIGLSAAGLVRQLIGVELVPQAIENAKENAKLNGITNAKFICADASVAAKQLASSGERPDVIIVDPPRKGLDEDVIAAICKMEPSRLVMVSCNPATAARDCKLLVESGLYQVLEITPVDMFPRTGHVECVVGLQRVEE